MTKKSKALRIFTSKNAFFCLLALIIQQLIVASSTLWIVGLSKNIVEGTDFSLNLILYLTSLILPYLPAAIMAVLLVKWEQDVIRNYINEFVTANTNRVNLWSDKQKRDELVSTANHEALQTINQSINYYFGLTSSALNTVLNVIVISILVDLAFSWAYAISLIVSFVLIKLQSTTHKFLTEKAQVSRIELGKSILSFWDNVVLGNHYNLNFWKKRTEERINQSIKHNTSASAFREVVSIAISVVTFLPSLMVAAYGMYTNSTNAVALAALVVIMPRLFLILSYTYNLLYFFTQFTAIQTRVKNILFAINPELTSNSEYEPRISWDHIQINDQPASKDVLFKQVGKPSRITIRGKNGSGKSSLLLELKRRFKDQAFYLPSQNHLHFSFGEVTKSTGETLREQLLEIHQNVQAPIILLDEWDANLDQHNHLHLSSLIDQIAKERCVIEVRHRY